MRHVKKGMFVVRVFLIGVLAASLSGQIQFPGGGSGSPYPGGPRNPYPGGNGSPIPGGRGGRGKTNDPADKNRKKDALPIVTTTGILRAVVGSQFVIEADDHRIITYKSGDKMTVTKDGKSAELSSFATADHLTVDANSDDQGYFTATAVIFNKAGTDRERQEATRTWDLPELGARSAKPAAKKGDDDEERPTLRRQDNSAPAQPTASAASEPAPAEADEDRPTTLIRPSDPAPDADDPGVPQIRRGKPAPRVSASNTEPTPASGEPASYGSSPAVGGNDPRAVDTPAEPAPDIIPVQEDPIIVKAKEAAAEYTGTLPNFFCRQLTTRFQSDRPKDGWQALDTITADLAYENGSESYTNIKVGNKPQKSMEDAGGSWSTGEFSSMLDDLFDPRTGATFHKGGQDTIAGRSATIFKFEVPRERSSWRISDAAQIYYPAFRGTIWIDRETSRVLRMEKESRNMPPLFPLVKVEVAVDYDFVRLAATQPFLLPTVSEVLSCEQGSSHCARNRIEFRNYRKFGAESGITYDEKQ